MQAVPGREIDVVLVSLRVDTGFEVDAVNVIRVPPVPGHLAWFDPRRILHLRRLLQKPDQLIGNQVGISFDDAHHAPGKVACA